MSVMKIMTHSGQNVTAYILNGSPIFFQVETKLYPSGDYVKHTILFHLGNFLGVVRASFFKGSGGKQIV